MLCWRLPNNQCYLWLLLKSLQLPLYIYPSRFPWLSRKGFNEKDTLLPLGDHLRILETRNHDSSHCRSVPCYIPRPLTLTRLYWWERFGNFHTCRSICNLSQWLSFHSEIIHLHPFKFDLIPFPGRLVVSNHILLKSDLAKDYGKKSILLIVVFV